MSRADVEAMRRIWDRYLESGEFDFDYSNHRSEALAFAGVEG